MSIKEKYNWDFIFLFLGLAFFWFLTFLLASAF